MVLDGGCVRQMSEGENASEHMGPVPDVFVFVLRQEPFGSSAMASLRGY